MIKIFEIFHYTLNIQVHTERTVSYDGLPQLIFTNTFTSTFRDVSNHFLTIGECSSHKHTHTRMNPIYAEVGFNCAVATADLIDIDKITHLNHMFEKP